MYAKRPGCKTRRWNLETVGARATGRDDYWAGDRYRAIKIQSSRTRNCNRETQSQQKFRQHKIIETTVRRHPQKNRKKLEDKPDVQAPSLIPQI